MPLLPPWAPPPDTCMRSSAWPGAPSPASLGGSMLGACQWSLWENGEQIGLGWGDGGCSGSSPTTCQLWAPRSSGGRCSACSCRRTGTDTLVGSGRGPRPGLRALGRRPGRGPQCWDQSQTGQETAAPVGTGLRRPKVPQTLPSSGPALAGGQTAANNGQTGRGQRPRGCPPELLQQRTSLLGPAGLAPFFLE